MSSGQTRAHPHLNALTSPARPVASHLQQQLGECPEHRQVCLLSALDQQHQGALAVGLLLGTKQVRGRADGGLRLALACVGARGRKRVNKLSCIYHVMCLRMAAPQALLITISAYEG